MKKVFMDASHIIQDNLMKLDEIKYKNYKVNHFKVTTDNEKKLKRIKGDYFVIGYEYKDINKIGKGIKKELMKILRLFFKDMNPAKPLIIGLGNSGIVCDSLGVNTTNKVMATNHFTDFLNLPKVALFNPLVTEKTGISSYSLIEMVVKKLQPTVIIMIDTLATNNDEYLNNCLEINNTGIIPGSAIKDNKKIDASTFNIPVIAIGVPLVLDKDKHLYTSVNASEVVDSMSDIISGALNDLFFK